MMMMKRRKRLLRLLLTGSWDVLAISPSLSRKTKNRSPRNPVKLTAPRNAEEEEEEEEEKVKMWDRKRLKVLCCAPNVNLDCAIQ